ncbi:pseudouridine synthase [Bacillus cereus BAG5X1-1]|uniref:Pseudouridine synthase n=1 Tax=Bacillus cereus BAG5X1-1 TaxID=1053189 RepID=J8BG06_BACCE|nr:MULTISPECIES: pseudouridine synthase [Bacillus cereus group]EJQ50079.1 pseudouridine synthase [Bacillus cereus BAG5X1-1]MDM5464616.1 pseudouridine synthase [Bacillus cereus]PGY12768.1 rRNA pseudouridine synthase [Bacillus cereus]QWH39546.1 rRNA pseudouridine synthase [Bacillus mycoides]QWI51628.1 rRNA pseudouridine synthase [Bacillus mycoides]
MRLDKLLANMGHGSRKEVKKLLKDGVVKIDGVPVKDAKFHVNVEEQEVMIHGEVVEYKEFVYLMMHKPQGVISATEDDNHETVIDLLELEDAIFDPFPVGRLDIDTEGFLLITNDGKLTHQLLSPKKHVPKKYYAHVSGVVTEEDVKEFAKGVILEDGYETKPGELTILKSDDISEIELVITEGKFHQVKRMFEAVGKKVVYLKRTEMGPLVLDEELELGQYRELTDEEVEMLKTYQVDNEK